MAHPRDIEPGSDELLLVELLYGELEGDDAKAAEEKVAADPELAADAEAFGELRALMRELPDEEPPQAVSARLLHAAAANAPVVAAPAAAGSGLWAWLSRIFRPFAFNPALAAVATFVLVAGVAGTLYMTGAVKSPARHAPQVTPVEREESRARAPASAPAGATSATEEPAESAPPAIDGLLDVEPDSEAGAGGAAPTDLPAVSAGHKSSAKPEPKPKPKAPARKSKLEESRGALGGVSSSPTFSTGPKATEKGDAVANQPPAAKRGATQSKDKWAQPPPEEKERQAPAKPSTTGTVTTEVVAPDDVEQEAPQQAAPEPSADDYGDAEKKPSAGNEARRLHLLAQRAARDGECEAVIDLGQRIRKLDSRYYDTVFLRDKLLEPCRTGSKSQQKKGK